jgi:nitrile hydratase accessory protein
VTAKPDIAALPGMPKAGQEATFAEPWQAQAFAMAVSLNQAGHFTWSEWAETLAEEIAAAQRAGDPDHGDSYYLHWLSCLERLVTEKGLLATSGLKARKEAWRKAAAETPHGQPVVLPGDEG